jgi:hypothetical protein
MTEILAALPPSLRSYGGTGAPAEPEMEGFLLWTNPGWRSLRELTRGYYLSPLRGLRVTRGIWRGA